MTVSFLRFCVESIFRHFGPDDSLLFALSFNVLIRIRPVLKKICGTSLVSQLLQSQTRVVKSDYFQYTFGASVLTLI